jgi:hypothetical protein
MPRTAINYEKTLIYKICCKDQSIDYTYIGHTTDFIRRKNGHKSKCNNEKSKQYHFKVYQTIREHGGWSNWCMLEVEKWPCKDGNEARAREQYWYDQTANKINMINPVIDKKKYNAIYRQEHKEEMKKYRKEHKEEMKKYHQEHREEILKRQAIYRQEHKEEINKKQAINYQENREKNREKRRKLKIEASV